MAWQIWLQKCN